MRLLDTSTENRLVATLPFCCYHSFFSACVCFDLLLTLWFAALYVFFVHVHLLAELYHANGI